MSFYYLVLSVTLTLLMCHPVWCDEDDVDSLSMPLKPDGGLYTTEEIIKIHNYTAEKHTVTTDDGYILTVFRVVPGKQSAPVVLLQHGYISSSDCWVSDHDALAFKLSDAGYDVWINNFRGNAYSRSHTKLKPEDKEFWNFSWHEMGILDLPAVIDYILKNTGQSTLHYIGHSMGTTVSYVMTSTRPEYNNKLKSLIALAPTVFLSKMSEMVGPDGMAEDTSKKYMKEFKESGKLEVFPRKDLANDNKIQLTCDNLEENFQIMCKDKIEGVQKVLGGPYLPAGQSFKTANHLFQISIAGMMKYFKYDTAEENMKAYNSEEPPSYIDKFNQITAPTVLWSTSADELIVMKDVDDLVPKIVNLVADNRIKDVECFNHNTFLFPSKKSCIPQRAKLYKDIIETIVKQDKK